MIAFVAEPLKPKPKVTSGALEEARALIWTHRRRLAVGLGLMVVSRLSDLVLPTTSKYLMDDVITQHHWELLPKLALAVSIATLVGAATSFLNSQVLGVAAQRAIAEMRKEVEAHVMRLPIRYFDSTKTGVLISRIMTRRGRRPQHRRHRPRAVDRLDPHGHDRVQRADVHQLAPDSASRR